MGCRDVSPGSVLVLQGHQMKILRRHWMIAILTALAVAAYAVFQLKGNDNPQYFTAKVDRGDISQVVEATGTINAVTTVQVGSQVSGTVSRLYADFNSRVKLSLIHISEPTRLG